MQFYCIIIYIFIFQSLQSSNTVVVIMKKKEDDLKKVKMGNICTYCSNLFKVADVTAHQEGRRSHKKVKHPSGQDRDVWLLPRQGLRKRHQTTGLMANQRTGTRTGVSVG